MKVSVQTLVLAGMITPTMCSPRGLRGGETQSTPQFVTPQGDTPSFSVHYRGFCGKRDVGQPDCPQVCPAGYKLVCQDNVSSGYPVMPWEHCTWLGDGYKLVG